MDPRSTEISYIICIKIERDLETSVTFSFFSLKDFSDIFRLEWHCYPLHRQPQVTRVPYGHGRQQPQAMPHPQRYQGSNVGLNQLVYNCLLGAVKNPGEFDWIQVRLSSDC
jgi:hypothetical protein